MRGKHLYIESDSKLLAIIRKRVNEELGLHQKSTGPMHGVKFVFYAGTSVVLYTMLYWLDSPLGFVLNFIALGLSLLLFAFNFAHDFSHNAVFAKKKWNNLGFIAIYTLVGAHAEAWRERHIHSHHFAPNVKEYDTDLQITSLIRVSPDMDFKWYHKYQHIYAPIAYSSYSLYWIFIKDVIVFGESIRNQQVKPSYLLSFLVQKSFYVLYVLVLPLLYAPQSVGIIFLGFLLMHLIRSVFLLFTFFMTHHVLETTYPETNERGIIQTSWLMNQIQSSNDMHPFSEVANFILGGFNNHIAHHLFPHISHMHYPRLNKILYRTLIENGITPNQTSYVGGAISHLKLLKKLSMETTQQNDNSLSTTYQG